MLTIICQPESVHGKKLRAQGEFSLKTICRKQTDFFENFPQDKSGKPINLADFESMPLDTLQIWCNHLIDSFSSTPTPRPFRFKSPDGRLPTLTLLQMAKSTPKAVAKGKKSSKPKSTAGKRSYQRSEKFTIIANESDESSMPDAEDTFSEEEAKDSKPPPPRTKHRRAAADKAKSSIGKTARNEAIVAEQKAAVIPTKELMPIQARKLPGSIEQRLRKKAALENTAVTDNEGSAEANQAAHSQYLQTRGMTAGTLLKEWKSPAFSADEVRSSFICSRIQFWVSLGYK